MIGYRGITRKLLCKINSSLKYILHALELYVNSIVFLDSLFNEIFALSKVSVNCRKGLVTSEPNPFCGYSIHILCLSDFGGFVQPIQQGMQFYRAFITLPVDKQRGCSVNAAAHPAHEILVDFAFIGMI